MRAPLVLAALVAPFLVLHAPEAGAAAPMCQGKEATIVGQGTITGTPGPDVIVATGPATIAADDGDDTICSKEGDIDAGPGHDSVEGTGSSTYLAYVDLGPGDDRYVDLGGTSDVVDGSFLSPANASLGRDVIDTGVGSDSVRSGVAGETNHDEIDLGAGRDDASVFVLPGSSVDVVTGPQENEYEPVDVLTSASDTAPWDIDLTTGSFTRSDVEIVSVRADASTTPRLLVLYLRLGTTSQVELVGTPGQDYVTVGAGNLAVADLGAGDDFLDVQVDPATVGRLDLGTGDDSFAAHAEELDVDLPHDHVRAMGSRPGYEVHGVEEWGLRAPKLKVKGDRRDNDFEIATCKVRLRAGGGNDYVRPGWVDGPIYPINNCDKARWRLYGQAGKDSLYGRRGNDVLIGGPGRDYAKGGRGLDKCRAEREKKCER